jgi:adenylyl-sulfate kinase
MSTLEPRLAQPVSRDERIARERQNGYVVWLTGLPASGKTTTALHLERALFDSGRRVFRLDGDELRRGLCADLGYSAADRKENVRRAASVAALFGEAGFICIAAFISPFRADRDLARQMAAPNRFVEVHVATPLEICRQRDRKGLYERASAGQIADFTGISSPYEAPLHPEITLRPESETPAQCVQKILAYLAAD